MLIANKYIGAGNILSKRLTRQIVENEKNSSNHIMGLEKQKADKNIVKTMPPSKLYNFLSNHNITTIPISVSNFCNKIANVLTHRHGDSKIYSYQTSSSNPSSSDKNLRFFEVFM